ncbi:MAG: ATP-binding protein [Planctomycetota bacterium]|nr:ATP-binding protein [Planctomycetota bacterium]
MSATTMCRNALEQKVEELARRNSELERSNLEFQQFAFVAADDLNAPLSTVSGFCRLLQQRYEGKLDADADTFLSYTVDGVSRMQTLIDDLLTFSRVDSQYQAFEKTDCSLVVDQAVDNLQAAIRQCKASVSYGWLPTVMADPSQLVRLFQNLIANAMNYRSDQPPEVRVDATDNGSDWMFSVRDNGIGIDPCQAERIFVTFQRLHTHNERPGSGIGLAICKRIVERHQGRIWVKSQPGKGATFYFTVPMTLVSNRCDLESSCQGTLSSRVA